MGWRNRVLCQLVGTSLLLALSAQAQNARATATEAIRAHQYDRALQVLHDAIKDSPSDPQLWTLQGVAYAQSGKKQDALTSFHNALKVAPDHLPALQQEAQLYYEQGDSAAVPILQHILRLRPGDPMSHAMIAVLEYKHGNCPAAIPHFEKAGEIFQSEVDALHAYAVCLVRVRQLEKAAAVLQNTIALKPGDPQEHRLLASVDLMAHQPETALAALRPILTPTPDAETLELAASAYEGVHDTEQAVNALRQAILLQPANTGLYLDFANMAAEHQSFQLGINVVNDGLALQPKAAPLYFARGMLYAQVADYEKAQADFDTAYQIDPKQSLSTAAQGLMAVEQNDLEGALKTVEQKLVAKPDDPILLYLKADILTQQGLEDGTPQFRAAKLSAKRAVALRPGLAPAHATLAKLYLESGQYKLAAAECRRTLQLNPSDQTAVYRLIQVLRKTGNTAEIPELLKRLAQLRQQATKEERERYRYKLVE